MMDYYEEGLTDTIKLLDENGIRHSGAGEDIQQASSAAVFTENGTKFGLLSYSDMVTYTYAGDPNISYDAKEGKAGCMPRQYERIKQDIESLRDEVDILAVSLHWGVEESFEVTEEQTEFARKLLDDGADMILGHHPHQFQGMEIYKGKPILYSMGNILFDQNDPENMESFIIEMEYENKSLKSISATPVRIVEKSHVAIQTGDSAKSILEREKSLCDKLGTGFKIEDDKLTYKSDLKIAAE
jgi:poly-gamma-glutamate synthesis protein (capsule biosynthesis protein)